MEGSGLGFIAITNTGFILIAGSMGTVTNSPISTKIFAINNALDLCYSRSWFPNIISNNCPGIARMLKVFENCVAWWLKPNIDFLILKLNT